MCRVELANDSFVFSNTVDCSERGTGLVSRGFKRLCVDEGLPGVRLHDLRHFVASQLLSAGVDVRTVAGRLGHRNAATTLNVYAHFLEQADRGAADVIGRVIAGEDGRAKSERCILGISLVADLYVPSIGRTRTRIRWSSMATMAPDGAPRRPSQGWRRRAPQLGCAASRCRRRKIDDGCEAFECASSAPKSASEEMRIRC